MAENRRPTIPPRTIKIMKAGIEAMAHLTMNETMEPNGISKSTTFT
jgi:hypothetical protein